MTQTAPERVRWTRAEVDALLSDGPHYEIIDGELFMTHQPHWMHQRVCGRIFAQLDQWATQNDQGQASLSPGLVFSESDDVSPDVAWASDQRLRVLMDEAGHLTGAPELVVEVLSPGASNERRDRDSKLKLYEVKGVQEYWIVDWRAKQIEVYRREQGKLRQLGTLLATDQVTSPLLPDFTCAVNQLFA